MSDSIQSGSTELPEVLRTLAGVLPRFTGADLESQLQTFDTFLGILDPSVRPEIARLLSTAGTKAADPASRERLEAAANSVLQGGRAAEPYDHAQAMEEYQKSFRQSFPNRVDQPTDFRGKISNQLKQIEAEMKRINFWSGNPPDLQAAVERGEIKSFLDAPTFELWLQCLFLPRARQAVETDQLPKSSSVGEMARRQYDYMSVVPEAETLLRLLQDFDQMVVEAGEAKG